MHDDIDTLFDLMERPAWHQHAACRGKIELMFPTEIGMDTVSIAAALCVGCGVRSECAEAGRGERWGVWGGEIKRNGRRHTHGSTVTDQAARVLDGITIWGPITTARLAEKLRCSERTVQRWTRRLSDLGLITQVDGHRWETTL